MDQGQGSLAVHDLKISNKSLHEISLQTSAGFFHCDAEDGIGQKLHHEGSGQDGPLQNKDFFFRPGIRPSPETAAQASRQQRRSTHHLRLAIDRCVENQDATGCSIPIHRLSLAHAPKPRPPL